MTIFKNNDVTNWLPYKVNWCCLENRDGYFTYPYFSANIWTAVVDAMMEYGQSHDKNSH